MSRIEELAKRYQDHIDAPWQQNLAGAQKTIFVVYPKSEERRLRCRMGLFEEATSSSGYKWSFFDFSKTFAEWMSRLDYRETYFEEPETLSIKLRTDFLGFASERLSAALKNSEVNSNTVVGVCGSGSLFGCTRLSEVLEKVEQNIRGRLLLFFPGQYENNNYRLLDARDGWDYLAVPITLHNGVND